MRITQLTQPSKLTHQKKGEGKRVKFNSNQLRLNFKPNQALTLNLILGL